jgi:hypothetical protein
VFANSLLREADGTEMCATVTIVDGLVFAKTPFNTSMNYRSVVVRGIGRTVRDEQKSIEALRIITDHIVPTWDTTRPLSPSELKATRVLALPLNEASAKVRTGPPVNEPEDETAPYWTGVVPVVTTLGTPIAAADSRADVPPAIAALESAALHGSRT